MCPQKTVCAAALTWVMGQRYMQTSKIMPAGVVAGIRYFEDLFSTCAHPMLSILLFVQSTNFT